MNATRGWALSLALLVPALAGAGQIYTIDPGHSAVAFSVRHLIGQARGSFQKFEGSFILDEKDLSKSSVKVTIDAASITTANEKRDNHLRSEDFFWVAQNPTAEFASTKVERNGRKGYKITGDLTLRGITKPVILNVEALGEIKSPWGNLVAAYRATARINRREWGLVWNKALETGGFLVGDEVELQIEIEASPRG